MDLLECILAGLAALLFIALIFIVNALRAPQSPWCEALGQTANCASCKHNEGGLCALRAGKRDGRHE